MRRPVVYVYTATLAPRDAVSGQTVTHAQILEAMGFEARLVADGVHEFFDGPVVDVETALAENPEAGWLVHFGVWSEGLETIVARAAGPRALVHHNTTPPELLPEGPVRDVCQQAVDRLPEIANGWACVIGDSAHNLTVLHAAGFSGGRVIPPLLLPGPGITSAPRTHEVMMVGRLAPSKGLDNAVKAIALVDRLRPDLKAELHIVGSSAGWDAYAQGVQRLAGLAVAPVAMRGSLSDADRDALYGRAGLLLVTSRHEGFCVPLVEAMRAGTPIVATDVGAVGETLEGAGILLPSGDPELVAEAIIRVLDDGALANNLSQQGRVRAKDFDADRVEAELRDAFDDAFMPLRRA
jgi:glycosyltransferase involved in cell wall biosynthesis